MNPHLTTLGISSELITARGLRECEEATALEVAEVGVDGRDHLLAPLAAEAWRCLKTAALVDGIDLFIISAFRSIDRQAEIVRRKLETGATVESILTVCAPPGFSEHHTGRAVDLSTSVSRALEVEFDQTAAYAWLTEHAAEFDYYLSYHIGNPWGYQYEPWHWCFNDAQPYAQAGKSAQPLNFTLCIPTNTVIYSYRKAEETDREAIYQLYCLVMRGFISEIWGWDEQWQGNDFSAHFDPQGITLVHQKHKLVGYSHVENRGGQLFIRMIVVHPHHQRKDIGRKLLESVIASGDEQSKGVGLEVFKINDGAKKFYEKFGFNVEGENPTSYVMAHA